MTHHRPPVDAADAVADRPRAPDRPGLSAHLRVRRGDLDLDLTLAVPAGGVVALLGPNGAGKSTALQALAGLVTLDAGRIDLGGRTLDDPATGEHVPTAHRRTGMVFQDYLLFPHLSALDNIVFGLRARGLTRREAEQHGWSWLRRVGLTGIARSRPGQLSGGQAQRVALVRALATAPELLLLDEPLAALDASTRIEVRSDLRTHLDHYTGATLLVTHDPLDAMILADTLVVLDHGRVVQRGTPAHVARHPQTEYVARLVGLNLYRGTSTGTTVHLDDGGTLTPAHSSPPGPALVAFAPSAVTLHRHRPRDSGPNAWHGHVSSLEQHADAVRVRLDAIPPVLADITTAALADLDLTTGLSLWATLAPTQVRTYPPSSPPGPSIRRQPGAG